MGPKTTISPPTYADGLAGIISAAMSYVPIGLAPGTAIYASILAPRTAIYASI